MYWFTSGNCKQLEINECVCNCHKYWNKANWDQLFSFTQVAFCCLILCTFGKHISLIPFTQVAFLFILICFLIHKWEFGRSLNLLTVFFNGYKQTKRAQMHNFHSMAYWLGKLKTVSKATNTFASCHHSEYLINATDLHFHLPKKNLHNEWKHQFYCTHIFVSF